MIGGIRYYVIYCLTRVILFLWHPVFHVEGRENVPKNQRLMICANHNGMADPFWICLALRLGHLPRIMAKREAMELPVIGWIMKKVGIIGVDREIADVHAVKEGLRALRDDQQLLIFPEGTRVKYRGQAEPKRGAVTMAARTDTAILPVYISRRRYPWQPVRVCIGQSYFVEYSGKRATDEELVQASAHLMDVIYAMEEPG